MAEDPDRDTAPESEAGSEAEPGPRRRRPRVLPAEPGEEERAPRRVFRARRERLIGGVCGGIAQAWGVDPALVRTLAALACFVGGAGIVGYVVALLLLPLERPMLAPAPAELRPRTDLSLAWIGAALVVTVPFLLSRFDLFRYRLFTLGRGALWPALLAGLVLWLIARRRGDPGQSLALSARRFTRPRRDRLLLGVASGFSRYAAVDANLVRVTLVVVAVWSYGIAAVLYLVVATFVPEDLPAA